MLSSLWNLLFFCVALGILISVHEAGHFIVARLCGVKVLRFSIGFGKVIFRRMGKDGCEYALSILPLGGYVKMKGEQDSEQRDADSFVQQGLFKRALIIGAGPVANIILALVLYTIVNMSGIQMLRPIVGDVVPNSLAERAGFALYDEIKTVNAMPVQSWTDTLVKLMSTSTQVQLEVQGQLGQGQIRVVNLDLSNLDLRPEVDPLASIGLKRCLGKIENEIEQVLPQSPAQQAGLQPEDSIVKVADQDTSNWYRVLEALENFQGRELSLIIQREGELYSTSVIPEYRYDERLKRDKAYLGVSVKVEPIAGLVIDKQYGLVDAAIKSLDDTLAISKLVIVGAYRLISGTISPENIQGPLSIAKGAGESASISLVLFLSFLAAISVNLGILNLLPIPILDGGQLLFIAYEALIGHEPNQKVKMALSSLGFTILICLMLFAIFNDLRSFT